MASSTYYASRLLWGLSLLFLVASALPSPLPADGVHTPICWTPQRPPPILRNSRTPRPQDIQGIVRQFSDEDTRRPPEVSTFARKGSPAARDADFEVPLIKRHITAMATLGMLARSESDVSRAFMYQVTDTIFRIEEMCSQERNWIGGIVAVNGQMALGLHGLRLTSSGPPNSTSLNGTEGILGADDFEDWWSQAVMQLQEQQQPPKTSIEVV